MRRLLIGGALALAILIATMGVLGAVLHLLQQSLLAIGLLVIGMLVFLSFWQDDEDDAPP